MARFVSNDIYSWRELTDEKVLTLASQVDQKRKDRVAARSGGAFHGMSLVGLAPCVACSIDFVCAQVKVALWLILLHAGWLHMAWLHSI